jgi:hypothetical protein
VPRHAVAGHPTDGVPVAKSTDCESALPSEDDPGPVSRNGNKAGIDNRQRVVHALPTCESALTAPHKETVQIAEL